MGFPLPGDVIEQKLDLNQYLIKRSASTFFLRVVDDMAISADVCTGDLLVVDRALPACSGALVVIQDDSSLTVTRFPTGLTEGSERTVEVWGTVTALIRQFL